MTEEEVIEAIKVTFPMAAIAEIYGNYLMDKEENVSEGNR